MGGMICFERDGYTFNYRAAAIIRRGSEVLLQTVGDADFYCLPGGRVHLGESAEEAVRRELREELGLECEIGRLVWIVEHLYTEGGRPYHECGLYFWVSLPKDSREYQANKRWTGAEDYGTVLLFEWHDISALAAVRLFPRFLRTRLAALPEAIERITYRDGV